MTTDFRIQHLSEKLGDRYEFQALLGRGAFAAVYLVRNLRLNRLEALKVLSDAHDQDENFVRRFIQEAKLVASLDHPNIVKVYDFGEVDAIVWFSMQCVDGLTLRGELQAQGRFAPITVARLAIPLLGALGYSHQFGTVHRDVKPSNILLDGRGHPYLMDFGIAKSRGDSLETMTGRILGTPAYISPEQIQYGEVDGRADLYALAAAMYEMLASRPPFQAGDTLRTIVQRLDVDPEPLQTYCPSVDDELSAIIMRALEREPDDRFSDAASMCRALVDYVSERSSEEDLDLMASAPQPVALEQLPTTVVDLPVGIVVSEEPMAKMESPDLGSDTLEPAREQRSVWAPALGFLLLLTVCGLVAARWSLGAGAISTVASPPLPAPVEIERPMAEQAKAERNVRTETESLVASIAGSQEEPVAEPTAEDKPPASDPAFNARALPSAPTPAIFSSPPVAEVAQVPIRRPVKAPRLLSTAEPVLSSEQATECAGQQVIVSLKVAEDGSVSRSRVLSSSQDACTEAAVQGANAYRFEPALDAEDEPVSAPTTVSIRFQEIKE